MFFSKTLQVFLGIAVFAAISSPTSVLAASNSRRLSQSKSSKKSKSASVTFTSSYLEADLLSSYDSMIVGGSGVLDVEGGGASGTTHFSCIGTKSAPPTALCDAQGCTSAGDDCIYFKALVDSDLCPASDISGVVFAGTGMYSGATGTFTTTFVCNNDGTEIDTETIVYLQSHHHQLDVPHPGPI